MSAGELTDATVRYLYATTWLPAAGDVRVVGGDPFAAFELRDGSAARPGLEGLGG